ncbi:MAG: ATP-dependent RecD-like DNA helicase [Acidobacteriota bacterium]
MTDATRLEGTVERLTYVNEETGFGVARLQVRGHGEVTAVGALFGVQPGETLRVTGEWTRDPKWGRQFKVDSYLAIQPRTFLGIERYLASGMVPGVGKEMAKRLVRHFGLETLDVIEKTPNRLVEVDGIGPVRSERLAAAWREQREVRDVMIFLQAHGVSPRFASKIYRLYGRDTVARLRDNPYGLATEVRGIGFRTADRIARDLGIPADSPQRAAAGVLWVLDRASSDGHTHLPLDELLTKTHELLDLAPEHVTPVIDALVDQGTMTRSQVADAEQPLLFLATLEAAERGLAERLTQLDRSLSPSLHLDIAKAIDWYEEQRAIELAPHQRLALQRAIEAKTLVITGGPGTGKTTLVRGIVEILTAKRQRLSLAAPTGRAAKRLAESTGVEAKTIHRLLEWNPRTFGFERNADHPLDSDVVVIDEASMLDVHLAYRLLLAIPDGSRLILVGDVDQLPSVGAGRVLGDVIDSNTIEVVRLTEIFRQAQSSLIVTNAHRIQAGALPESARDETGDFFFIARDEPDATLRTLQHLVAERIPKRLGFDPLKDVQVLSPMQRGVLGVANVNAELQALLNPEGDAITRAGRLLRVGDRVMQTRNNYDLEVFNGDIGRITQIDDDSTVHVSMDGRNVVYEVGALDELVLAYACSIHKSQGSEYPCVVIPLSTEHHIMLQRNLLYTAVTRGKKLVVIVGSRRALARAVRTATSLRRHTQLAARLRGEL